MTPEWPLIRTENAEQGWAGVAAPGTVPLSGLRVDGAEVGVFSGSGHECLTPHDSPARRYQPGTIWRCTCGLALGEGRHPPRLVATHA